MTTIDFDKLIDLINNELKNCNDVSLLKTIQKLNAYKNYRFEEVSKDTLKRIKEIYLTVDVLEMSEIRVAETVKIRNPIDLNIKNKR